MVVPCFMRYNQEHVLPWRLCQWYRRRSLARMSFNKEYLIKIGNHKNRRYEIKIFSISLPSFFRIIHFL